MSDIAIKVKIQRLLQDLSTSHNWGYDDKRGEDDTVWIGDSEHPMNRAKEIGADVFFEWISASEATTKKETPTP